MTRTPIAWKDLSSVVLLDAGVYQDERGVCVPFRLPGGAVHNVKVHARGRSWWATSGLPLIPFGLELVPDRSDDREGRLVWLAEGESDALCLREHYAEWRDRPVDVLGLPGSSSWRPAWSRHLSTYTGVYVFPDADDAGERMAAAVTRQVRRGIVVYLPAGDDVRALIQRDGPDALDQRIVDAERVALLVLAMRFNDTLAGARRWLSEVTL